MKEAHDVDTNEQIMKALNGLVGSKVDTAAMDEIAALLDGEEWDSDTAFDIAVIVRRTGRYVGDVDDSEEE